MNMIKDLPAWYTKISIKTHYEKEGVDVYWDIPEYSGYSSDTEYGPLRPDAKIIDTKTKTIFVLEMSIPWIENRNIKLAEKEEKYTNIVQNLKIDNPGYTVKQLTFIVDCLGGYAEDLRSSLMTLGLTKPEVNSILPGIQKILIVEANSVINHFKILTAM